MVYLRFLSDSIAFSVFHARLGWSLGYTSAVISGNSVGLRLTLKLNSPRKNLPCQAGYVKMSRMG